MAMRWRGRQGGYPVQIVLNADPEAEMASSVRTGRQALSSLGTAVVVALCDYPLVAARTIAQLIENHHRNPHKIVIPCHNGHRGHPPLFPRPLLDT